MTRPFEWTRIRASEGRPEEYRVDIPVDGVEVIVNPSSGRTSITIPDRALVPYDVWLIAACLFEAARMADLGRSIRRP